MERRYLVVALALIATFAGFSSGLKSLQKLSLQRDDHVLRVALPAIVSHVLAKLNPRFHQTDPEEAQMLAEMNMPIAVLQARAAEEAARQSQIAADRARDVARREAERAHREALKMRDELARQKNMTTVVSIDVPQLDRRMQAQAAAMAQRMAAQSARMQIAAAKWQAVSWQTENSAKRHSPCGAKRAEMQ